MIYDPDHRGTTKQLMSHTYFSKDEFVDRFEVELKRTIEMEREKDYTVLRRKKPAAKKVLSAINRSRNTPDQKEIFVNH